MYRMIAHCSLLIHSFMIINLRKWNEQNIVMHKWMIPFRRILSMNILFMLCQLDCSSLPLHFYFGSPFESVDLIPNKEFIVRVELGTQTFSKSLKPIHIYFRKDFTNIKYKWWPMNNGSPSISQQIPFDAFWWKILNQQKMSN